MYMPYGPRLWIWQSSMIYITAHEEQGQEQTSMLTEVVGHCSLGALLQVAAGASNARWHFQEADSH